MTRRSFRALRTTLGAVLVAGSARAEPSASETPQGARVALVWIFGDDDAFNPPDARVPPSPAASIGDRPGYDPLAAGYRSRYTGRENRLELRLSGTAPGLVPSLSTAAELALGIDLVSLGAQRGSEPGAPLVAEDIGSFVEARLSAVSVRLYPIDGDLERVGWLEALGWGGASGPRRESPYETAKGAVRAAHLSVDLSPVEAFVGLKTASFVEPVPNAPAVEETSYGVLGGVVAQPSRLVKLGVAGGYFEHGMLEGAARQGEKRAITAGGSARLSIQRGMDEPRSPVTFLGQGDDPFRSNDEAPSGSFAAGIEAAALVQRLGDFDRPGETTLSPARAFALFAGARFGRFETSGAVMLRDPEFVMRNAPGVFPGQTLPRAAQRDTERTLLLSNGFLFSKLFRADLALGLRFPAAVMTAALDRLGQPIGATLVVGGPGDIELLPPGSVPVPVFDARAALELGLSKLLSAVAWTQYRRDYNRTRFVADAGEMTARGFADPDRFGYGIAARAVW